MNENRNMFELPSGREATVLDVLGFCYGLSETDIQVLMAVMSHGPKTTDSLERELKLSKATINRSLNKLLDLGLVERIKETGNKAGRPKYVYKAWSFEEIASKITKDVEYCAENITKLVKTNFNMNNEIQQVLLSS